MTLQLDKNVLKYLRFTAAMVFAAVFSAIQFIPFLNIYIRFILLAVTVFFYIGIFFIYLPIYCRSIILSVGKDTIIFKRGIITKKENYFPLARLVYIKILRFPTQTPFGLCTVILRGVGYDLRLMPMSVKQAIQFKETLEYE